MAVKMISPHTHSSLTLDQQVTYLHSETGQGQQIGFIHLSLEGRYYVFFYLVSIALCGIQHRKNTYSLFVEYLMFGKYLMNR